jgi:hypothetical protein
MSTAGLPDSSALAKLAVRVFFYLVHQLVLAETSAQVPSDVDDAQLFAAEQGEGVFNVARLLLHLLRQKLTRALLLHTARLALPQPQLHGVAVTGRGTV